MTEIDLLQQILTQIDFAVHVLTFLSGLVVAAIFAISFRMR